MKTLIFADRTPDIPVSELLEDRYDLIILAGDLDDVMLKEVKSYPAQKVGVYGNHCSGVYFERLGVTNLNGKAFLLANGQTISGLEGCPRYKPYGHFQYYEDQVEAVLEHMQQTDILVSHCPPRSINDEPGSPSHEGFLALLNHIQDKPPRVLIHGHTYPLNPVTEYRDTEIVYVSGHRIIDL
jgi:predicted phosphodiesterase